MTVKQGSDVTGDPIYDMISDMIADQLGIAREKITASAKFKDDLGADSLDVVECVMRTEDLLHVKIPDEAVEKIETVGEFVAYVKTLV